MLSGSSLSTPIYAAAGLSLTSVLCTFFLLPGEPPPQAPIVDGAPGPGGKRLGVLQWSAYSQFFARPGLRSLLIQFFLYMFAFSTFTSASSPPTLGSTCSGCRSSAVGSRRR